MATLDYSPAGVSVREDLRDAHERLWIHLASPGNWWTGAQRVAIATAARSAVECKLCQDRKGALSPENVQGEHTSTQELDQNTLEAIHRIRTDPARLSKAWFDQRIDGGLSEESYVELVGVVTLSTGVDYFCRALGMPAFDLPRPIAGEPTRTRPDNAKSGTAWVAMLAPEDVSGPESDLYGDATDAPNIMRALSLVPNEARALQSSSDAHYVAVAQIADPTVRRAIDRMQMELVASRVSALNECFY